ncbi:PAS and ANTAR domain-containing protein [Cellulomonas fimi]|uniref:ANTAR domain-containing protein n=1 Tax=Cellulomonas fimi TaxID=1708 RepID=UPI00234CB586|nr:ANTAR domain-containing protein [Cellulomonas fimi]MDC7122758.1 PAS and ANTAR domain-containing protein [Cellulomonas fimi]
MEDLLSGQFHLPADGGRPWWSDELYTLLGMTPGDVPPTLDALTRHVRVDERDALREAVEACARDGIAFAQVHTVKRLEGEGRVMAVAGVAEESAGGGHDVRGVVVDVSSDVRARAARAVNSRLPELLAERPVVEQAVGCLGLVYGVDRAGALEMLRWSADQRDVDVTAAARLVMAAAAAAGGDLGLQGGRLERAVSGALDDSTPA